MSKIFRLYGYFDWDKERHGVPVFEDPHDPQVADHVQIWSLRSHEEIFFNSLEEIDLWLTLHSDEDVMISSRYAPIIGATHHFFEKTKTFFETK